MQGSSGVTRSWSQADQINVDVFRKRLTHGICVTKHGLCTAYRSKVIGKDEVCGQTFTHTNKRTDGQYRYVPIVQSRCVKSRINESDCFFVFYFPFFKPMKKFNFLFDSSSHSHTHARARTYAHTHVHYLSIYLCEWVCVFVLARVCVCACARVCVYVFLLY